MKTAPPENEELERMARAISPYGWNDQFWQINGREHQYNRNQEHVKRIAREGARAALESIREPTDRLVEQGLASTATWLNLQGTQITQNREKMRVRWRRMIDTMLDRQPKAEVPSGT